MKYKISPSILSADFSNLSLDIEKIEKCGIEMLHIDVMDGHFVPNITIGAPVIKSLRKITNLLFDVHLMITDPQKHLDDFINAGSDIITVHAESDHDLEKTIDLIKNKNKKAGVSINPDTSFDKVKKIIPKIDMLLIMSVFPGFGGQKFIESVLPKIREAKKYIDTLDKKIDIEIDGGINDKTISLALDAGANIFVAGNYIFSNKDISIAIKNLTDKFNPPSPSCQGGML